jgi:large subunit ribosomal protein L35Ae
MKALVVNFRGSYKSQEASNHVIIKPESTESKEEAAKLVGKKITWSSSKASITGVIAATHGNSGCVRAIFERGLPGQAISTQAVIE